VVEDNVSDVYLIKAAIQASGFATTVTVRNDGELATNFFDEIDANPTAPSPDLIILDLNLPKRRGAEVLEYMRRSARCQNAKVIVVSTSGLESDQESVMKMGADAYFRKPSEFDEFLKLANVIKTLFLSPAREK
jgi:DNA-binding response OmpR family regulator